MPLLASPCLLSDFPVLAHLRSLAQVSEKDRTTLSPEGARVVAAKPASQFQAHGRLIVHQRRGGRERWQLLFCLLQFFILFQKDK